MPNRATVFKTADKTVIYQKALKYLVTLEHEYQRTIAMSPPGAYVKPPTTDQLARHLGYTQPQTMLILNHLQLMGSITKNRRKSAGPSGNGYDGSLYSEVHPTERTLKRFQK